MDYYNYNQCLEALDQKLKTIASFAKLHGYQSRIENKKYIGYYQKADDLCRQIIKLKHGG